MDAFGFQIGDVVAFKLHQHLRRQVRGVVIARVTRESGAGTERWYVLGMGGSDGSFVTPNIECMEVELVASEPFQSNAKTDTN